MLFKNFKIWQLMVLHSSIFDEATKKALGTTLRDGLCDGAEDLIGATETDGAKLKDGAGVGAGVGDLVGAMITAEGMQRDGAKDAVGASVGDPAGETLGTVLEVAAAGASIAGNLIGAKASMGAVVGDPVGDNDALGPALKIVASI